MFHVKHSSGEFGVWNAECLQPTDEGEDRQMDHAADVFDFRALSGSRTQKSA